MDWRDIRDEKEKYTAYLCSREWGAKKRAVHQRAHEKCERCLIQPISAVHHLTYERKYQEKLEDLQAICDECHKFTHGLSDKDPKDRTLVPSIRDTKRGVGFITCPICKCENVVFKDCDAQESFVVVACVCKNKHAFSLVIEPFTSPENRDYTVVFTKNFRLK